MKNVNIMVNSKFVFTFVNGYFKYRKTFQIEHIKLNINYQFLSNM